MKPCPVVIKLDLGADKENLPISHAQAVSNSCAQAIPSSSAPPKCKCLPSSSEKDSDSPFSPTGCTTGDAICINDDDGDKHYSEEDNSGDDTDQRELVWPADFFIVDIVAAFSACDKACHSGCSVGETFTGLFGVPFWHTTFYKNQKQWDDACQPLCDKSLTAGKTSEGQWSVFLKASWACTPKAAKKHSQQ